MSFLDDIERDIQEVFLDIEEAFAEMKSWNGKQIPVIVLEGSFEEDPDGPNLREYRIHRHSLIVAVDGKQIDLPKVYDEIEIDGETWLVMDVRFEGGMLLIGLDKKRESAT